MCHEDLRTQNARFRKVKGHIMNIKIVAAHAISVSTILGFTNSHGYRNHICINKHSIFLLLKIYKVRNCPRRRLGMYPEIRILFFRFFFKSVKEEETCQLLMATDLNLLWSSFPAPLYGVAVTPCSSTRHFLRGAGRAISPLLRGTSSE